MKNDDTDERNEAIADVFKMRGLENNHLLARREVAFKIICCIIFFQLSSCILDGELASGCGCSLKRNFVSQKDNLFCSTWSLLGKPFTYLRIT